MWPDGWEDIQSVKNPIEVQDLILCRLFFNATIVAPSRSNSDSELSLEIVATLLNRIMRFQIAERATQFPPH